MSDSRPDFPIVGIGASAGGYGALREMLAGFPGDPGMALVVVLHPEDATQPPPLDPCLTARMRQVTGGETIEPGQIYVVPPGRRARIGNGRLDLYEPDTPPGLQRPIDELFESLGTGMGRRAAGVLLSDAGADGGRGLRAIKENGGLVGAHTGADGTPLLAGLADFIHPAPGILPELARCFHRAADAAEPDAASLSAAEIAAVCRETQDVTGHDFRGYARSRLTRCIQRRMRVLGLAGGQAYVAFLRGDPGECEALLRDLLVSATRFFRDPGAFAALRESIEPMIRDCPEGEAIRIWVAGCSSGEEAYSLALLFRDAMIRLERFPAVSITGSDIDSRMLALAREARYPLSALAEIPEPLRARFTVAAADHFTLAPQIRDMVRFCSHSLIKDPPFARIDLIFCRNLLSGFGSRLQRAVLPVLHESLRPGGLLLLGADEGIGGIGAYFAGVSPDHRLLRRRPEPLGLGGQAAALSPARQMAAGRARRRLAIAVAQVGLWEYDPATGASDLDRTERALFGLPETGPCTGEQMLARVHPEDRERVAAALRDVSAETPDFDETFRVAGADGYDRWLRRRGRFTAQAGDPCVLGATCDVSTERNLLEERALHLAEVNHRIKNLFALVSAMISSVERESTDTQDFSRNLRGRISALDRAHALMRRDDMRAPIPLDQLIERVLEPSRGGQAIVVEGPETLVPVRELTPLVLILHEWTTNSAKYGALSGHDGALTLRWSGTADSFCLEWTETATEAADHATTGGFGSRLVQASILQLRAELEREVSGGRLRLRLTMPAFPAPPAP